MIHDRRHIIDFLKLVGVPDEYGELCDEWTVYKGSIWASKKPILGNEYFTSLTTSTKVEIKFNVRYLPEITDDMRIKHGDLIYEILSVINVESLNRELLIYCRLVK